MAETQETIADIIAEARDKYTVHECNQCAWRKCCSRGFGSEECGKFRESIWLHLGIEDGYFTQLLNRLDAAHKREVDALNQRCAELDAEVAAKDEVIKRLNDAIAEEQRRKMATTKESLAVGNSGDCAKLREAMCEILSYIESFHKYITPGKGKKLTALFAVADTIRSKARAALAAPPRNCDVGTAQEQAERWYWRYHVGHLCQSCPLGPRKWSEVDAGTLCFSEWQQMPYEEGKERRND